MSRHRFVKALDLDDELDVYDGEEEEYDPDTERNLREGTVKVKAVTGDEFTDEEIRDSLWHYYYDVEKTVNYLNSMICPTSTSTWLTMEGNRPTKTKKKQKPTPKTSKGTL
jgi:elongation factor 1 alpha-like protein